MSMQDVTKFLDRTVRTVKREVNKKVLKVPEIEAKTLEATSNEPWGPHGALMSDIAQATRNYTEYQMVMNVLWKRLNDTGKNWRHVYKALTVLEFLIAHGTERVIDELKEHQYQLQTLVDFQYVEPNGKDQGINVRKKAQTLVGLVNDKEKIREARQKAQANRDKYRGFSSTGSLSKGSSYGGDDRYGEDRDRYDSDKERDRYGGGGDRDGDRYGDDKNSGRNERGGSASRYGGDDDDFAPRGNGTGGSSRGTTQGGDYDSPRAERRSSKSRVNAPPSYEDTYMSPDPAYGAKDDEKASGASITAAFNRAATRGGRTTPPLAPATASGGSFFAASAAEDDGFDDFDPRGAAPKPAPAGSTGQVDLFGSATPAPQKTGVEDLFGDVSFQAAPAAPAPAAAPAQQASSDFFGDSGFTSAPPAQKADLFGTPAAGIAPPPQAPAQDSFGDFAAASGFTSAAAAGNHSTGFEAFGAPQAPPPSFSQVNGSGGFGAFGAATNVQQGNEFESFSAAPQAPKQSSGYDAFGASDGFSSFESAAPPASKAAAVAPAPLSNNSTKSSAEFEPKQKMWVDTLSTGIIDLNLKPAKDNPLANLGITLDPSVVQAQEPKPRSATPTNMGRAMGSGSGLGVVGAGSLTPPVNPMGMGGGMAGPMGGGVGMGMGGGMPGMGMGGMGMGAPGMGMGGMGMGAAGMGMGMGAPGMGMGGPGMGMGGMGMPGGAPTGMNPQMGMGGMGMGAGPYGAQQQYGGFR